MENTTQETTETQSTETTEQPSWYFTAPSDDNEGVPGNGELPSWFKVDKYKSVDEQAKAYNELATRFGGFEAAPKDD